MASIMDSGMQAQTVLHNAHITADPFCKHTVSKKDVGHLEENYTYSAFEQACTRTKAACLAAVPFACRRHAPSYTLAELYTH